MSNHPLYSQVVKLGDRFTPAAALVVTILLAATIAYLTLSAPKPDTNSFLSDKVYHILAFAALLFPTALAHTRSLIWVIPAAMMFGAAIELIQPYVGRSGEIADFIADLLGVGLGLALGRWLRAALNRGVRGRTI